MCAAPVEMNEGTHSGKSTIGLKAAVVKDPQTAFTFTFTFTFKPYIGVVEITFLEYCIVPRCKFVFTKNNSKLQSFDLSLPP